jgi:glutamate-ammonia-ligase adenylyltransferase
VAALRAAHTAGLLDAAEHAALLDAWRLAGELRNAIVHVTGRGSDELPRDARVRASVARLLGRDDGADGLVQHYRQAARRSRRVVEARFYGT